MNANVNVDALNGVHSEWYCIRSEYSYGESQAAINRYSRPLAAAQEGQHASRHHERQRGQRVSIAKAGPLEVQGYIVVPVKCSHGAFALCQFTASGQGSNLE